MHHITAFGGSAPSLFSRAIPQSPGYFPYGSKRRQDNTLRSFLAEANITTLNEARKISTDVLITANANSIGQSLPYVSSIYGPTIDGTFVQEDPKVSLRVGKFDESVKLIISHNSNEGLVLVQAVHTSEEYVTLVRNILTRANDTTINYVTNILYPPVFDGSMGYAHNYQRAAKTAGDIIINCNAASLSSAYCTEKTLMATTSMSTPDFTVRIPVTPSITPMKPPHLPPWLKLDLPTRRLRFRYRITSCPSLSLAPLKVHSMDCLRSRPWALAP